MRTYSKATANGDLWRRSTARPTIGQPHRRMFRNRLISSTCPLEPGEIHDIVSARILGVFGDMVTTDHISPAGSFTEASPAGQYLTERQVSRSQFNSYGSRRGNHQVMMRGTFANTRIRNELMGGAEGGRTLGPEGNEASIYEAAMEYKSRGIPLVVVAGAQYGSRVVSGLGGEGN